MKLSELNLEKDKHGNLIVPADLELDLEKGDSFVIKVGRKYKKIVIK